MALGTKAARTIEAVTASMVVGVALLFTLFPVVWTGIISLKTQRDAFTLPPSLLFQPVLKNYAQVWQKEAFRDAVMNSTAVTLLGVGLAVGLGTLTAYALCRLRFRGKRALMIWLLLAYTLPEFLYIVPMYVLYQTVGLYDTRLGLALVYQVFALPFSVWMLRSFFDEVPPDLDDAARIDGCDALRTLWHVYIPISAPGIAATAVLTGIWMWNELAIALALTFRDAETVTVAVASFRGYAAIEWGPMTAASMTAMAPMLVLAAFAQKYIVKGLTLGAVK